MKGAADRASDKASEAAAATKGAARDTTASAKGAARDTAAATKGAARDATASAKGAAGRAADVAHGAAEGVRGAAADAGGLGVGGEWEGQGVDVRNVAQHRFIIMGAIELVNKIRVCSDNTGQTRASCMPCPPPNCSRTHLLPPFQLPYPAADSAKGAVKAGAERAEQVAEEAADKGFFLWKVRGYAWYLVLVCLLRRECEVACLALRSLAC